MDDEYHNTHYDVSYADLPGRRGKNHTMDKGIYYYKTYDNSQITAIDMNRENLDGEKLIKYPMIKEQQIRYEQSGDRG